MWFGAALASALSLIAVSRMLPLGSQAPAGADAEVLVDVVSPAAELTVPLAKARPAPTIQARAASAEPVDTAAWLFPDTRAGRLLREFWRQEEKLTTRKDAQERYAKALERLRGVAAEASMLLYDAYQKLAGGDALDRYQAVMMLRDLGSEHAIAPLESIAREALPAADPNDHLHGAQTEEESVRLAAVSGLGKLAANGSEGAGQALLELLQDPSIADSRAMRVRAIRGYVGSGPDASERAAQIADHVPPELAFALKPGRDASQAPHDERLQALLSKQALLIREKR